MKKYLELFLTMFKISLFTFGGGYWMIALLENELVVKKKWLDSNELMDLVGIAESTPGPIAINIATYIGYKRGLFLGSVLSTIAIVLPSFIIIYLISLFFNQFLSIKWVSYAFLGIQIGVIFLILKAGIRLLFKLNKSILSGILLILTIAILLTLFIFAKDFSSIILILGGAIIGLLCYLIPIIRKRDNQ